MTLINLRGLMKTIVWFGLSEREEVSQPTTKECYYSNCDSEYKVVPLSCQLGDYHLKTEICYTLENISYRKWICRIIEFKADHFLSVSIDGAVCEAPKEAHNPCHVIKFVNDDIPNSWSYHEYNAN